jgi:ABC-type Fe3+ transport system substrate-binding protein
VLRRYFLVLLFVIVLVAPFALKAMQRAPGPAEQPDALQLVIVTPNVESIRREFADAFSAWHQAHFNRPVHLDYRLIGGASDIVRYFESSKASLLEQQGTFRIDIAWGGGDVLFNRLKRSGILESVRLPDDVIRFAFPRPSLNGVMLLDAAQGTWYGTALSSFGICYNRDVCRYLGMNDPVSWNDLADPRYQRWLALADPTRSSAANAAFMTVVEKAMLDASTAGKSEDDGWAAGMGLIRQISANARLFTDAGSSVPGVVAAGDAAAGMVIDFHGRSEVDAVGEDRMGYVEPAGATTLSPDPIAVIKGAEHRELAIRFIEFVLSGPGQRLWITRAGAPGGPKLQSLRRLPVAPAVYADQRNFTDHVDPFGGNFGFTTSARRKQTFVVLARLIQLSCIDLLDELRATRQSIIQAQRPDLDRQLGTFPFDQQEAIRRGALWDRSSPLARLELERAWKEEFRAEYRRLQDAARQGSHARN